MAEQIDAERRGERPPTPDAPTTPSPTQDSPTHAGPQPPQPPSPVSWLSPSLRELLERHRSDPPVAAGAVVAELLDGHPELLDEVLGAGDVAACGPVRSVAEHLEVAATRWDPASVDAVTERHVVLALALDPQVGRALVASGVIASLLGRWERSPERHGEPEPDPATRAVMWDRLSDAGRVLADEQPLLATALGAPAEWSVQLTGPASALAWAPEGDQLAVLVGGDVLRAVPDAPLTRLGTLAADTGAAPTGGQAAAAVTVVSGDVLADGTGGAPADQAPQLGWGVDGVVVLQVSAGNARVTRLSDGKRLGDVVGVTDARVSGDATSAWLVTPDGLVVWTTGDPSPRRLAAPVAPLALDRRGSRGLVGRSSDSLLLSGRPEDVEATGSAGAVTASGQTVPGWPTDTLPTARVLGIGRLPQALCALVSLDGTTALACAAPGGGVVVEHLQFPPVARLATGPGAVTALAVDPTGTRVAVAVGQKVGVWGLAPERASASPVPRYDSDQPGGADLLEADQDARAIAALVSSEHLHPPLAIGLFGVWGSGKSFVLNRIRHFLDDFTGPSRSPGYLEGVRVIEFNAWHYAETDLWASLVDQVLREISPQTAAVPSPEVTEATELADRARDAVAAADLDVEAGRTALDTAQRQLARQRWWAASVAAGVLTLAAVSVVAVAVGGTARLVAAASTVLALLGSAVAILDRARRAGSQASELVEASRDGLGAAERLLGRPQELAVRAGVARLRDLQDKREALQREAERLDRERARTQEQAESQPLEALLSRLSTIGDYRERLSLVTRTRDHFRAVDAGITRSRKARQAGTEREPSAAPLERIVVLIDDLDRCAPEKVVTVLEAVHLLFGFEMFVVLIAVDTRWLDQSLRIRYRQLLGRAGTAAPSDYLEKIIQVPLHLMPLSHALVRSLIAGLTGTASAPAEPGQPQAEAVPPDAGDGPTTGPADDREEAGPAVAAKPRPGRERLPAEVLRVTDAEASAMSVVSRLIGDTPRTVKRYVNTYQIVKARALDVSAFDLERDGLGDHEVVAFLLAVVTGHAAVASQLLPALANAGRAGTLASVVATIAPPATPLEKASLAEVVDWVTTHDRYAQARAARFAEWAGDVARFSFTPARLE